MKPKAKKEDKKSSDDKTPKVSVAKLLDQKRSQNVGIFIKSKHLEIHELENCIYNFDNSVIDFETLGQVKFNQATNDEMMKINGHMEACPDIPIDFPEQFLLDLSQISNFNERLECFMFQQRYLTSAPKYSLYICLQRAMDNLIFGSKHDRKIAIVLRILTMLSA